MSLAIKYESLEDARMRLRNTVVRYKGDPVLVLDVLPPASAEDGIYRIHAKTIPVSGSSDEMRKFISSKYFDISAFRMGYVNHPKGAFYCSRIPTRQQKQGLSAETFKGVDNHGKGINFSTFTATKEVINMVNNDYPSFSLAKRALAKCPSVAFSRDFCLEKDSILEEELLHVYHKGTKVGACLNGDFILGKNFKCLKESLQELGVTVK